MKLAFSFSDDEQERVERVMALVKSLFRIERTRGPVWGKDGKIHVQMNTPKR